MKTPTMEKARITLQVSARVLQKLQAAADLGGVSLKQFLVQAAQKEAGRIIDRAIVARASREDAALGGATEIIDAPGNPHPPNAASDEGV